MAFGELVPLSSLRYSLRIKNLKLNMSEMMGICN